MKVHVVGAGLIGASIGLALRGGGHVVTLADHDDAALSLAVALGAGELPERVAGDAPVDVVVVAVPPDAVATVVSAALVEHPTSTVMDIASIKSQPLAQVAAAGADLSRVVGTHPVAGRERSGPAAAREDLFAGRPWVVCATPQTGATALDRAREVVLACGGAVVEMSAEEHDRAVALVSHLPQVAASLTARRLVDAPEEFLQLAGTGLRDTTRVAASDPRLWTQILGGNAAAVRSLLAPLIADLQALQLALADDGGEGVEGADAYALLADGQRGRARLPGKHGAAHVTYATVPVVVEDRPGELARLFAAAQDAGVNVEDIAIEHSPGQPVGQVELAVDPGALARLVASLRSGGWDVRAEESGFVD